MIAFDATPRILHARYEREVFPLTPYLRQRYNLITTAETTKEDRATVCVGPVLLAMTPQLGMTWDYTHRFLQAAYK